MKESKFWEKVYQCKHENLSSDYSAQILCGTPYCGSEDHCLDCEVYIQECQCGFCNGLSGWLHERNKTHLKKKGLYY